MNIYFGLYLIIIIRPGDSKDRFWFNFLPTYARICHLHTMVTFEIYRERKRLSKYWTLETRHSTTFVKKKKNKKTYPSLSHTDKIQVNCFIYNLLQYVLWVPSLATHANELLLLFLEWHAYELWFSEGIKMVECMLKLLGWNVVSSVLPPLG